MAGLLARSLIVLAIVVGVGLAGRQWRNRPSSLIESLRSGQITIDRFVRAERAAAPGMFDRRLLTNNERALRQSFPDGTVSNVRLAGVSEGPGWLRAHVTYQGVLSVQGESARTRGQIVIYYGSERHRQSERTRRPQFLRARHGAERHRPGQGANRPAADQRRRAAGRVRRAALPQSVGAASEFHPRLRVRGGVRHDDVSRQPDLDDHGARLAFLRYPFP